MFKLKRIKFKKIKDSLKRLPRTLAENAFLTFLGLLVIALILGGLVFYKYSILTKKVEPQVIKEPLQFKEKTYEEILKVWQEKEKRFQETDFKEYPNPFKVD